MPIDLSLLPDGGVSWLDASGEQSDIVLSTRIRLARNVEGFAFTTRARDGERLRILSKVREAVGASPSLQSSVMIRVDSRFAHRWSRVVGTCHPTARRAPSSST